MADLTLKQARAYLQGKVATLTDAPAYEYMPFLKSEADIKSLFGHPNAAGDTVINGWAIGREGTGTEADTEEGAVDYTFNRTYTMIILGYYGVQTGAEELVFEDQIEALLDGLDADSKLGGNADEALPPVVRRRDYRVLANILCHHCEIALTLRMRRDRIA